MLEPAHFPGHGVYFSFSFLYWCVVYYIAQLALDSVSSCLSLPDAGWRSFPSTPNSLCMLFLHLLTGCPAAPLSCGSDPAHPSWQCWSQPWNAHHMDILGVSLHEAGLWVPTFTLSAFTMGPGQCWPPHQLEGGFPMSLSLKYDLNASAHFAASFQLWKRICVTELGQRDQRKDRARIWPLVANSQVNASVHQRMPSRIPGGSLKPSVITLHLCLLCFSYVDDWV